jgi:transposase
MNEHDFSRLPPAAQAYIRELEAQATTNAQHIAELTERIKLLEEQFRLAQSKRFAPSSEKLKDRVFDEAEQMAAAEPAEDDEDDALALPDTGLPDPDKPAGRKRGRKPLPAELPRQRIEYDLTEDQKICTCCQGPMHRLGEEVSEQLHIETKVSVLQHVRFKYACRQCERNAERTPVLIAPMPTQPLPGSNASAAMLATVTTGKYVDGTPLYRMEDALGRAWHTGQLDHPARATALQPAVRRIAPHAAVATTDPCGRDDGAGAQGGRQGRAEQVVHVVLSKRRG